MFKPRTLKILALLLLTYGVVWLVAYWTSSQGDSLPGLLRTAPLLAVYALHGIGVPGLLAHGGQCGWGWCAPTTLGWCVAAAVILAVSWFFAWAVGVAITRSAKP